MSHDALLHKIQRLSHDRIRQVEDFVDFLLEKEAEMNRQSTRLSEAAFEQVWDNAEDEAYDAL